MKVNCQKSKNSTYMYSLFTKSKFFLCTLLFLLTADADILLSKPAGPVNDFAGILSQKTKNDLIRLSSSVYNKTGVALVLATVPSLDGDEIDDLTNKLYEKWGIGKKGVDEGVLILLAMKERKIRIETGYGVEGYITDLQATRIRQNATTQYLARNQWDNGIAFMFISLIELIAQEKKVPPETLLSNNRSRAPVRTAQRRQKASPLQVIFVFILIIFLLGTRTGRAMLPWILLALMSGSRRSSFGGGGFGGGFSGGGGFGGGMSGGGGSSGGF